MLKAKRCPDKKVHMGVGPGAETPMPPSNESRHRPDDYSPSKNGQNMSQNPTPTPHSNICTLEWGIAWQNVYPHKQYLNLKTSASITNPNDIADAHATTVADNSSSARYITIFQTIKDQDEVRIDFMSNKTEVSNKTFRLRDLRRTILKAKPLDWMGRTIIHWNISPRTYCKSSRYPECDSHSQA